MAPSSSDSKKSFWARLYDLKLWVSLLVLSILTIALFIADAFAATHSKGPWAWFGRVPWEALASAMLAVVLIAFGYEWYARREYQQMLREIFDASIQASQENLTSIVRRALMLDPQSVRRVLSGEIIDEVILAGLERKVGDPLLARESYENLLAQLLTYERRISNCRCKITMAPISGSYDAAVRGRYYEAFVDLRYDGKLTRTDFWFTAVSNIQEYNRLVPDSSWEVRCVRPPTRAFPAGDERAFTLHSMRIAGIDLDISEEERGGHKAYVARHSGLTSLLGSEVTFEYRYSSKMEKAGHVYMYTVVCPTRNVTVEFDYALADIGFINVFDFFVSHRSPSIRMSRTADGPRSVEVELNDWVLPKSGVLFGWVLNGEMTEEFTSILARPYNSLDGQSLQRSDDIAN